MHRLFSIGKDRRLFEYDVYNSQAHDPLIVISYFKIFNDVETWETIGLREGMVSALCVWWQLPGLG